MNSSTEILSFSILEFPSGLLSSVDVARNWGVLYFCSSYNYPKWPKGFKFFWSYPELELWSCWGCLLSQLPLNWRLPFMIVPQRCLSPYTYPYPSSVLVLLVTQFWLAWSWWAYRQDILYSIHISFREALCSWLSKGAF